MKGPGGDSKEAPAASAAQPRALPQTLIVCGPDTRTYTAKTPNALVIGDGKTSPTLAGIGAAVAKIDGQCDTLVLSGHGTSIGFKKNIPGTYNRDLIDMKHSISVIPKADGQDGALSTKYVLEEIYAQFTTAKPKNILITSCYGGAAAFDVENLSAELMSGTMVLSTGKTRKTVAATDSQKLIDDYLEQQQLEKVDLATFFAKQSLRSSETLRLSLVVTGSDKSNHTITVKAVAPKNLADFDLFSDREKFKAFFTKISDYNEGRPFYPTPEPGADKPHQRSHFIIMADRKATANCKEALVKLRSDLVSEVAKAMNSEQEIDSLRQNYFQEIYRESAFTSSYDKAHEAKDTERHLALIKQNKALLNVTDEEGNTPLLYDVANRNESAVDELIAAGVDLNIKSVMGGGGSTPLNYVLQDILKLDRVSKESSSLQQGATLSLIKSIKIATALIEAGADINIANNKGVTPASYIQDPKMPGPIKQSLQQALLKKDALAAAKVLPDPQVISNHSEQASAVANGAASASRNPQELHANSFEAIAAQLDIKPLEGLVASSNQTSSPSPIAPSTPKTQPSVVHTGTTRE